MATKNRLKPCPFCGKKPETFTFYTGEKFVRCKSFSCCIGRQLISVTGWNRRVGKDGK
jgi:hypothetical protein